MAKFMSGLTTKQKVFSIIRMAIAIAVIVLALLQLFEVWDGAIDFAVPLMAVMLGLQAIAFWKSSKVTAIINICAAVIIIACSIAVWVL